MSQVVLHEGAAAATPAAGKVTLYAKTDGFLYSKDDAGTETLLRGDVAAAIDAAASKITPANNDEIPLADSAASWALKKLTWTNLKATLATWLETLTATWSNKTLTNPTVASNLTFSGTGNRIIGDFSNATIANRVMFQSSTASPTQVSAVGNSNSNAGFVGFSALPDGYSAFINTGIGDAVRIGSGIVGTGSYVPMTFYTGGAKQVTIDTSGNVGIGVTPDSNVRLHAQRSDNGLVASFRNTSATVTMDQVQIYTTNKASASDFYLFKAYTSGPIQQFGVRGDGLIECANGIKPSSSSDTLSVYDEDGIWTPVMQSATAGTGRVTTKHSASYIKIGKLVHFTAYISMTTLGTGGSGGWEIRGLPFAAASDGGNYLSSISVGYFGGLLNPLTYLTGTIQPSASFIQMRGLSAAATGTTDLAFSTYVTTGTTLVINGTYTAAS